MSYRYLIKLKPLEPFFFGGEYTFGADESRKESSRYSAISTQFPQQTAILGMLRKVMLIQNGNLTMHLNGEWVDSGKKGKNNPNFEKAKKLVGTDAFSYDKSSNLGVIESISPLFITQGSEHFIANAKDYNLEPKEIKGAISMGNGTKQAFIFEGYDAKVHNNPEYISNTKSLKNYGDFFEVVESVGIKKPKDGKTQEDAFFRKSSYSPRENNIYFTFILTLTEPIDWKEALVSLGADQSSFKLEVEKIDKEFKDIFSDIHKAKNISRVVLSSETLLTQEAYELCEFILGSRKSYRQLINSKKGKKSKRYYLLERGSVLYSKELDKLEKLLNQVHLQKIGINHYITTKGRTNV